MQLLIQDKDNLFYEIVKDLRDIADKNGYFMDHDFLHKGVEKVINQIEKDNFHQDDLNDYNKFPLKDFYNSLMGTTSTNILVEAKIRGVVIDNIEKILSKYIYIPTISKKIENQYKY
ncbi:hypothetical protein ACOTVS_10530 [Aliarcobacter butzleri]